MSLSLPPCDSVCRCPSDRRCTAATVTTARRPDRAATAAARFATYTIITRSGSRSGRLRSGRLRASRSGRSSRSVLRSLSALVAGQGRTGSCESLRGGRSCRRFGRSLGSTRTSGTNTCITHSISGCPRPVSTHTDIGGVLPVSRRTHTLLRLPPGTLSTDGTWQLHTGAIAAAATPGVRPGCAGPVCRPPAPLRPVQSPLLTGEVLSGDRVCIIRERDAP